MAVPVVPTSNVEEIDEMLIENYIPGIDRKPYDLSIFMNIHEGLPYAQGPCGVQVSEENDPVSWPSADMGS